MPLSGTLIWSGIGIANDAATLLLVSHAGQRTLALLQRHFPGRVLIATTNEDDLLERAGAGRGALAR